MKDLSDLVKGWFAKAENDLLALRLLAEAGPYDMACFHAQQCVEKYMKGFLTLGQKSFPFTHDLRPLADMCFALDARLDLRTPGVILLTEYAVKLRYDNSFSPMKQVVLEAIVTVEQARESVRALVPSVMLP